MSWGINARDLDNYITGHYGEDQYRRGEIERDEAIWDDEGYQILDAAKAHFKREENPKWDVSEDLDILNECQRLIEEDFTCRFCGEPTPKKRSFCSPDCAKADGEGL